MKIKRFIRNILISIIVIVVYFIISKIFNFNVIDLIVGFLLFLSIDYMFENIINKWRR